MRSCNRKVTIPMAALFLLSSSALAQNYAPPFPREGAEKVQESDAGLIWDVTWTKGETTGMHEYQLDQVSVILSEGALKVTRPDGRWSIERVGLGSVRYEPKGTLVAEEGASDTPIRAMVVQLKDGPLPKWPITEGIPGQFPREGASKLFETDRITVWDQTWKPGVRSPVHLHYNRAAVVVIQGGSVRSFPDLPGAGRLWKSGDVFFMQPLKAPHSEEQLEGSPRAIFVSFK